MIGMLLAAGRGDRMEPLSSWVPKPALDVLGRPLLASSLDHLRRAGCTRVVVNLHRHPEAVAAAVRQEAGPGLAVGFSRESRLLGGAGGVAAARELLGPGDVLVANADTWIDLDLSSVLAGADDEIVLALLPHPNPTRWGGVVLNRDGRVERIFQAGGAPPDGGLLFTGFQRVGAAVVAALPPPPCEWAPVWDGLRLDGRLRGVVVSGTFREAGTPAAYHRLVTDLLAGASWVHPHATVALSAELVASAVGAGCRVDGSARVEASVLTGATRVAAGARVTGSVVVGATVAAGVALRDTLLLPDGPHPLRPTSRPH